MEYCAFIKIHTTGNDLYGKNNCPIRFECELSDTNNVLGLEFNPRTINIIPDEDIMPSGFISVRNTDYVSSENKTELPSALEKIYKLLSVLRDRGFYIIGFSHMNYDIKVLNDTFKRVLDKSPIVFDEGKIIDVMRLSEIVFKVQDVGCYSINSVYSKLFQDFNVYDTPELKKVELIYKKVISENSQNFKLESFSDVVQFCKNNYNSHTLNFGKYKGEMVDKVFEMDKKYCSWLIGNKTMRETKPEIVETISRFMNEVE